MVRTAVVAPSRQGERVDRRAALLQRLRATAETLGVDTTAAEDAEVAASQLFGRLVDHVRQQDAPDRLWLLLTALAGAMPEPDEVKAALHARITHGSEDFAIWLLEACSVAARTRGTPDLEMDVVHSAVVVDVDFSATHELHTGIQRVVRETVPRWHGRQELALVAWTAPGGAMRHLLPHESERILRWHDREPGDDASPVGGRHRLVVPWHTTVLLPENPQPEHCPALAAAALYSGSHVALIGYDCIPVISPELIHPGLPDRFMRYLQAVKHAHRIAGISAAATREFQGFVDMLGAQGLAGPRVVDCPLPVEVPPGEPATVSGPPLVVCVGSFEPRKNQLAVLQAAEQLWRAGMDFQLEFIGGGGWTTEFDALMARLTSAGRPVRRRMGITDAQLWGTLRAARFSVFVSLHEGFGLPVAESLACGTPCLTSDYGATREIAVEGGALTVDPMDDQAIADQMRRLLTDDELVAMLREQALRRPSRTWDDYARELWAALVGPGTDAEGDRL